MKGFFKYLVIILVIIFLLRSGFGIVTILLRSIAYLVRLWYITIPLSYLIYIVWSKKKKEKMKDDKGKNEIIIEESEIEEVDDEPDQ